MAWDLFVAHAAADKAVAEQLYDALATLGVRTFLASRSIGPGERWDRVIPAAQREARATVVLVSPRCDEAFYLGDEVATGIALSRANSAAHAIVPVYVEGAPADAFAIPYGLRVLQGLDLPKLGGVAALARRLAEQVSRWRKVTAPTDVTPAAAHATASSQWEPAALHERLCKLLDVQFEAVVLYAGLDRSVIAAGSAPLSRRALDVVGLVMIGGDAVRDRVEAAIRRVNPSLDATYVSDPGDDPVAAWIGWGLRRYREVPVLGFRGQVRLTLDDVFVQLQVSAGFADPLRRDRESMESRAVRTVSPVEAFALARGRGHAGIVLLGDPGSGKTTLLQHLYTRVALGDAAALGLPRDTVPVLVRFASITAAQRRSGGLRDVLEAQAARDGHEPAGAFLRRTRRTLLFLLDGLDEVREEATRVELCRWLDDELAHFPDAAFMVGCRYAAWQRDATLSQRFLPVDVLLLDDARVREYVVRWFRAVALGLRGVAELSDADAAARGDARAARVLAVLLSPERHAQLRLRDLTGNPLLLSTLCLVSYEDNDLPERRSELYDRCVRLLLEAWTERRHGRPALPNGPTRLVLEPLAWAMHTRDLVDASGAELEPLVAEALREVQGLALSARELLERARDDCGVFTSYDVDRYRFLHLTLQEYLAACHAQRERLEDELAAHAGDPRWQEVILLAVARGGLFEPFVRALVLRDALAQSVPLLRECLLDTDRLRVAPFVDVLDARVALRDPSREVARWLRPVPKAATLAAMAQAVFALLRGREHDDLRTRAEALEHDADVAVSTAARQWLGRPARAATIAAEARLVEPLTGMTLLWVPPGSFTMGSADDAPEVFSDEKPAHRVTLTEGFYLGQHPVTNAQYQRYVQALGVAEPEAWQNARFNDPAQPVVTVSWEDAQGFCRWLSEKSELAKQGLRATLPTEAEWEYAARGTDGRRYPWGDDAPTPERAVWGQHWDKGSASRIGEHAAGRSAFGCEDMAGNVWEWCLDVWRDDYGSAAPVIDPCHLVDIAGSPRVVRGGAWGDLAVDLRCAARVRLHPGDRGQYLGFRVVVRGSRQPR